MILGENIIYDNSKFQFLIIFQQKIFLIKFQNNYIKLKNQLIQKKKIFNFLDGIKSQNALSFSKKLFIDEKSSFKNILFDLFLFLIKLENISII